MYRYLILSLALFLCACGQPQKTAWIVLDLTMPYGSPARLAFDNPAEPDMTQQVCNTYLQNNVPVIMKYVREVLKSQSAKYVTSVCVMSVDDPLKLTTS